MKRLLPAPLLSASLFGLWLTLNQSLGAGHLALAAMIAIAVPLLTAPLRPIPVRMRRPAVAARLVVAVAHDVIVSNAQVGWRILTAHRAPRAAFVRIPLELRDPNALAVLAMITTIVPGTVWSELARDHRVLLLHVFDLDDEDTFVTHFKLRYEQPLREIFE